MQSRVFCQISIRGNFSLLSSGRVAPKRLQACDKRKNLRVCAWGDKGQNVSQLIPPAPAVNNNIISRQPLPLKIGVLILVVVSLFQIVKRFTRRGSRDSLENRGLVIETEQSHQSNDPFYSQMMKNVNTVQYDELSPEQIAAARQRRSQDRSEDEKVDLNKIQLPANHPFAVSKQISDEEEQLQNARLRVRRGVPLKDVNELQARQNRTSQQQQDQQPQDRGMNGPPSSRRTNFPNDRGNLQ